MGKVKVGILTLPLSNNYGGILQAAALYEFLQNSGFEPVLVRRQHTTREKDIVKNILARSPFSKMFDPGNLAKKYRKDRKLRGFIDSFFLNRTPKCFSATDLEKETKSLDCFVVGSDQVWRYAYTGQAYKDYFLEFVPDEKPRFAYGASFGLDRWEGSSEAEISDLLARFSAVSVREKIAVKHLKENFKIESSSVLDPTFLVDRQFYYTLMGTSEPGQNHNVFNYVLDQDSRKQEVVKEIGNVLNIDVTTIDLNSQSWDTKPGISEWLKAIFNARFIVTDSFHGMVFSIIFNKPFIAIANKNRGFARFESLVSDLDLQDRLISDLSSNDLESLANILRTPINFNLVNEKIDVLKNSSQSFLLENLNIIR